MIAAFERLAEGQSRLVALAETPPLPGPDDAAAAREIALNKALNRLADGQTRLIDLADRGQRLARLPNITPATRRIWISSDPSVIR